MEIEPRRTALADGPCNRGGCPIHSRNLRMCGCCVPLASRVGHGIIFRKIADIRTETRAFLAGLSIVAAHRTLPHFTSAFIQTARFLPSALFSLTASTLAVNLIE